VTHKKEDIMENIYIDEFFDYMTIIKGRSEGTIKIYASTLEEFFNFIYQKKKIDFETPVTEDLLKGITKMDGVSYIGWCATRGNSANTRNRKVITLRTFFKYLEDNEGIKNNIDKLEISKTTKSVPKYLTENEALELLNLAKRSKRDYAIILMFLTCGLRVSEMASLNRSDIRADNTMVITGKGNKQRKIWLTDDLIVAINRYLETRDDNNPCMWTGNEGSRYSKIGIQFMVKDYLTKIGREDCSVHKLRHTFATLMYQSGSADLLQLQQILGHSSPSTTQIYTHVADEQLAECVKHNPLVNKKPMKKVNKKPKVKVLAS